jgi:hypothetical protein
MAFFSTSQQLYSTLQILFERMNNHVPNPLEALYASRLIIRFKLTDPSAEITVNGRIQPVKVYYGKSAALPDLGVELSADTLHQILMDELSLRVSLAQRQMKVTGPIWKTSLLADILHEGRKLYPHIIQENGFKGT